MKDPMDRPTEWREKSGPCLKCGYPEVVARKSRKTGELYSVVQDLSKAQTKAVILKAVEAIRRLSVPSRFRSGYWIDILWWSLAFELARRAFNVSK